MSHAFRREFSRIRRTMSRYGDKMFLALLTVLLPSCAMEGDFGRPKTYTLLGHPLDATYWASDSGPILGTISEVRARRRGETPGLIGPTAYKQTPEEREMRQTAYRLRVEIQDLTPMRFAPGREGAFANTLTYEQHNYGPSRISLIENELRSDHETLSMFAGAARRVTIADRDRMYALQTEQRYLTPGDARNARNRMRKNCAYIVGTFNDLDNRIRAYDYAITRTKIETPGYSVFGVEGTLNHFRDRAASLQYELTQVCQLADADMIGVQAVPVAPPPAMQGYSYKPAYYGPPGQSAPPAPGGKPTQLYN